MVAEQVSMRQIREIPGEKWALGQSHRAVARSPDVGPGTVSGVERRVRQVGPDWARAAAIPDDAVEARLYATQRAPGPCAHPQGAERAKRAALESRG